MIVESELPIAIEILQPNKGDRIVEDANFGTYRLDCLVREGKFLKSVPVKGLSDQVCWVVKLDSGKQGFFDPSICKITERAAASVLVEESKTETPLEPQFKVGDRVYQENPDNTGVINKISRGKALVSVSDRTVIVPIGRLHHCDPNYSPIPKKSEEEIKAEEEAAIAKARGEYLKSQSLQVVESILVEAVKPALVEVVGKEILLPFDHEIPDKEKGDENYTPDYFIEACRNFLGWFDLDPFSNAIAQKSVRAKTFWTKHDNALTKDWTPYLKKFVNPPYSQRLIGKCIDKILEFCAIGETILIVNSSTSAKWFQRCKNACSAYLNPSKRLPFYNPYREIQYLNGTKKRSGNEYDQTVFYFGTRPLEFAKAMEHLGSCSIPIKKSSCLPTTTGLEVLEPSVMQPESPAKLKQLVIQTSAKMLKPSTVQTSLKSQSLETLDKRSHQQELISTQGDSPAQEPPTQGQKQDSNIQSLLSGLNISGLSTKDDLDSLSSKTQLQLLITHCEQYLEDSEWLAISGTIRKSYKQLSLEVPKRGSDYLSLDTLTSNKGVKSRSSGQSKCEKWFRDRGLLLDTQCLSPQMMAVLFGFPMDWTKCLWDVQEEAKEESDLDISLEEPSTLTVVQQSLKESCTSIAVLVGTIVKPKFNGGTGKVVRSTKKKISVSWSGANNVVTYSIADFHNQIDILSQPIPSIDETNLANPDDAIATKPSKSVAISRMDEVLGVNDSLDERLAYLQSERDRLISSGASPKGIWIEKSKPAHKPNFVQAVWKSDKPRPEWGDKKSQYIGEYGKDKHKSAIAIHQAGQQLRIVEREIKSILKKQEKRNDY